MKLSELCAQAGVSVATAKFYLREGLLPAGTRVSATQADYSAEHVQRLSLIRALVEGAGVPLSGVRRVLDAVERPPSSRHELLGEAQQAIDGPAPDVVVSPQTREAAHQLGWTGCSDDRLAHLQAAVDTAERAGIAVPLERMVAYGEAMGAIAALDIAALEADPTTGTPGGALRYAAVGTVVTDPVLQALRRLAQEHASAQRYGAGAPG